MANYMERKYLASRSTSISIATGKYYILLLPTPNAGSLHKFVAKQQAGTSGAYVIDVFDSLEGTGQTVTGAITGTYTAVGNADLFRVIPQFSKTAGQTAAFLSDQGTKFRNYDVEGYATQKEGLYVVIAPTGASGTTVWELAATIMAEIG